MSERPGKLHISKEPFMTNVERIKMVYAAFGRGDVPAILEIVSEDADWGYDGGAPGMECVPWLKQGRGKAKALEYFKGVGETIEFHGFAPVHVFGDGDDVLALVELDFTVKKTGCRVKTREVMHFTFDRAGKIMRYRPYLDTAQRVAAGG